MAHTLAVSILGGLIGWAIAEFGIKGWIFEQTATYVRLYKGRLMLQWSKK